MAGFDFEKKANKKTVAVIPKPSYKKPSIVSANREKEPTTTAPSTTSGNNIPNLTYKPTSIAKPIIPKPAYVPTSSNKYKPQSWGVVSDAPAKNTTKTETAGASDTNPFASMAYSLAGGAVDGISKAIQFLAATIGSQKNIKVGENISGIMPTVPVSTLAPDKESKSKAVEAEQIFDEKQFDAFSGQDLGSDILTSAFQGIESVRKPVVESLAKKADVQNQPKWSQTGSNIAGSIPYTLTSRIPYGVGTLLNFGTSTMQGVEQKIAESGMSLGDLTREQKIEIMNYAVASAAVSAGSEALFPAGKGVFGIGKAIASKNMSNIAKEIVKYSITQMGQEAAEEGVSYIGTGIAAKITTDPDSPIWDENDPNSLLSLKGLGETMYTAALSALVFSSFGLGGSYTGTKIANTYSNFKNSKAAFEQTKNIPLDQITPEQARSNIDAIIADTSDAGNRDTILEQAKEAVVKIEENMPVNERVSMLQNIIQEVYASDPNSMSEEQYAANKETATLLQNTIDEIQGQPTVITDTGKKRSISQIELIIQNREMEIRHATEDLRKGTNMDGFKLTPDEKLELEETISNSTKDVNKYKAMLAQATQPAPTSAELLAKMQQPRTPLNAPVASSNGILPKSAQNATNQDVQGQTLSSDAIKNAPSGYEVESVKNPKESITSTVKAVPISSVIASTDADGNTNASYDQNLQPRNTDRNATKALIADIATEPGFLTLVGMETLQEGSPVIGSNGMVVTGNHRIAGLMQMLRDNPTVYAKYKEYVRGKAKQLGLDPAALSGDFVLVRVLPEGTDLASLVNPGNTSGVRKMSSSETAVNDSKQLSNSVMAKFVADENGEMTGEESRQFNARFINEVVPESERASLFDANGKINMDGVKRIQNAMFYKAYGNLDLLNLVAESTDNNVKKLTNSLIAVSPRIVALKEGIAAGRYYDIDTAAFISSVAQKWVTMKKSKGSKDILAYLRQETMFKSDMDLLEKSAIVAFESNKGSARELTAYINEIIDDHMYAGAPTSGFFGEPDKIVNLNTIMSAVMKGGKHGTVQTLENLYAEESAAENARAAEPVGKTNGRQDSGSEVNQKGNKGTSSTGQSVGKENAQTIVDALAGSPDSVRLDDSVIGIVPKGFSNPYVESVAVDLGLSEETKASMKRTATFPGAKNGLKDILNNVKKFVGNPNWGSVEVSNKYGDLKRAIRLKRASHGNASDIAKDVVNKSYGVLDQREIEVFKNVLVFLDIRENIKSGMYNDGKVPLPHRVKTMIEMENIILKAETMLKAPENENVRKALDTRKKLMDVLRDEVIAAGKKVGIDLSYIKSRDFYVYNAPWEMYAAEENNKLYKSGTANYKARKGTAVDYISNPIISDYLIIDKLARDLYNLEVLAEVAALDISDKIEYDTTTGDKIIPEGYLVCSKNEVMGKVQATNEFEKNAVKHAMDVLTQNGINPKSEVGKNMLRNARQLERKAAMVIPVDVYNVTVDEYSKKQANQIAEFYRKGYHLWKFSKIRAPFVVWKYNYRNTMGDLEMVFMGIPKAIFKIPRAMYELYRYFYKGDRKNVDVMNHLHKTGGISGATIQDLNEVAKIPELGFLPKSASPKEFASHYIKKLWGALTLEKFTNYREQVLRYAAYLQIRQDIAKNGGKVKDYIASSREEIDSIRDLDDKAIKLSNDLLGAYDDVSKLGQTIANNLIPFFRFKEIMIKRYVRMTQNAFYVDGAIINKTGADYAKRAGHVAKIGAVGTMRIGKLLIKLGLFNAAIAAGNAAFGGDDEDKLPEDVKNQPHIIFPHIGLFNDKSRVYYLSNIGVFSQLLGTFDIDYADGAIIRDLFTGKKTWDEVVDEVSFGFNPAQAVMGINPLMVSLLEVATGKKAYYFDPENPSLMRDRMQYIFEQAGFGPIYTYLAKLPANESTYTNALANSVATGDAAMWAVYDMTDDYYAENDISAGSYSTPDRGTTEWNKKNAAYYYKVALRLDDAKAIEKYLAEYVMYGGTQETLDASVASLEPLRFMDKDYKDDFLKQLTPEEKEKLKVAQEYFKEISLKHDIAPDIK